MNANSAEAHPQTAVASIDLLPYLEALVTARYVLALFTLVGGLVTAAWAYTTPPVYLAGAKVSVVDIEDPGGVSPDDRRASEVLTLVEHGFVMGTTRDNYNDVMIARLVSRDFTMRFIEDFNIYRYFYPQQWSEDEQRWLDGFTPDRGASFTRFRDEVRSLDHDEETDIVTVMMKWTDPIIARDMANQYVAAFNEFMREKTMQEVARKQAFLQAELRRSDVLDIQQSLYRLIEAQTAIAMLASAREEYVLEVIDPAATAYRPLNLSPKRKTVIGLVASLLLAVFVTLALVLCRSMLVAISRLRGSASQSHDYPDNFSLRTGENSHVCND